MHYCYCYCYCTVHNSTDDAAFAAQKKIKGLCILFVFILSMWIVHIERKLPIHFLGTKRLPPSLILVRVQNHSLLDALTFPLIFFIIANFHNKLKRQQYFRYFIFNRF
jgi:hypothetical protein